LWFMDKDKFELAGFILETEGPSWSTWAK
jgi:hypothetical protein